MQIETIGNATLYRAKYQDVLPLSGMVDAVIADPPYGVTCNEWDEAVDFPEFWQRLTPCLKRKTPVCVFSQQPFTTDLIASNRKMFRYDIIWSKQKYSGFLNAKKMPLRMHENISVFYGRLPTYNPQKYYLDRPSWRGAGLKPQYSTNYGKRVHESGHGEKDGSRYPGSIVYVDYEADFFKKASIPMHPTQKPVGIMEYLVKTYTNPGENILDPFMGSGTTGVAAARLGRRFIGVELEPKYFDIACRRIEEAQRSRSLLGLTRKPATAEQLGYE